MGDTQLKNDMTYWPFKVAQGDSGPAIDISGKYYPPEEIASYLLKQIVQDASTYLRTPIKKVVITVPAYFTDGQRAATLDAGELAGLEVLEILNEPTAAAIAYKLERFHEESRNVLIFDMGGGTFDVAVINTDSTSIEVLSVDGDTHLGGEDFDKALMHFCLKRFQEQHKVNPLVGNNLGTKTDKDVTKQRLRRLQTKCENAKVQLSFAPETTISVDSFYNGIDLLITIAREEFEKLIESLFNKAIDIVDRVLKDAEISKRDIHDIVLIGGSTRIPRVRELIIEFFDGKALNHTISPDEAVAYGSAVKAAILNGDQSKKMYNFKHIRDVIPRSLGIRTWMFDQEGQFTVIIPKSSKIPAEAMQEFRTKLDNQSAVEIKIFQGEERMADDNEYLGEFILSEIPPAPAGQEVIEVCMRVNNMGILHVTAVCKSTNGSETLIVSENKGRLSAETKKRIAGNKKITKTNKENSDMPTLPHQQSQKKGGILRRLTTFKKTPK
ncbi:Heat shock 70 kDa protein 6 [Orchesella cincta]|uniref:Heat shock 70 kDa protein 6 n=1 Tax=Orchesella cincta TaxID=48709 RepID=A0A1D2M431_ORCCI|nr:Heat shock 70 kDa protein 6 [Orchesella cincta]